MLEQPQQTLNSVLLLVLVSQLTTATLIGVLLEGAAGGWGVVIGIVLQIFLFFVIGEVAPKTFAVQHTERAALSVTPLLWFLTQFAPLRWLSKLLIGVANVVLPGKGLKAGPFITEEEIRTMADVAASEDVIEREEQALIHSIFEFGDTVVREVMQPSPDVVTVDCDDTIEAGDLAPPSSAGYSRLPLRGDDRRHHRARLPEGPGASRPRRRRRPTAAHRGAPGDLRPRAEAGRRAAARDADRALPHGRRDRRVRRHVGHRHHGGPARGDRGRDRRRVRRRDVRASSSSTTARCGCRGACRSTT